MVKISGRLHKVSLNGNEMNTQTNARLSQVFTSIAEAVYNCNNVRPCLTERIGRHAKGFALR